jgi:hypothetical protein
MHTHRLLRLLICLAIATACLDRSARGQEDDGDEPVRGAIRARTTFVIPDQTFDNIVFGNVRGPSAAVSRFQKLLEMQIDEVDRACNLSDGQKTKLQLAGRGDIKRYFDRIDEKRRQFQDVKNDMNKFAVFQQELQPLRVDGNSAMFGESSIFAKTIPKILTADQTAQYEEITREKRMFRHRAKIALVIATLDNSLGLTADQRRRLEKVLVDETRPPRESSQYDFYVILLQAANLPEEKLKPIFDNTQWRSLAPYFTQSQRLADFLKTGGYLPEGVGSSPTPKAAGPGGRTIEKNVRDVNGAINDAVKTRPRANVEKKLGEAPK